ncbi:MAG TPA: DNA-3-methyladenine glycosylase [Opitutaceae bacterium]|jgi:DNA-3-methyladenine glycosylase|nr:DNA-3-methyladenine glycosylase [Opitutaceae bacterium]
MRLRRIRRSELPTDTTELARFLVGAFLVLDGDLGRLSGRIVETEAYLVGDAAAHSYNGPTARNRSLFLERGHAYVYFIYGNWHCMNVSGESAGIGAGVLLRAMEPIDGLPIMQARRPRAKAERVASGPGCLATAMGIDRHLDGVDLCGKGPFWLGTLGKAKAELPIGNSTRIGLTKEAHRKLRFYLRGSPSLSGSRRLNA